MTRSKWTPEKDAKVLSDDAAGVMLKVTAYTLGVSVSALTYRRKHLGVPNRARRFFAPEVEARVREMDAAGVSRVEMGRILGMSSSGVTALVNRLGLEKRGSLTSENLRRRWADGVYDRFRTPEGKAMLSAKRSKRRPDTDAVLLAEDARGTSIEDQAKRFGVCMATVWTWRRRLGLGSKRRKGIT